MTFISKNDDRICIEISKKDDNIVYSKRLQRMNLQVQKVNLKLLTALSRVKKLVIV